MPSLNSNFETNLNQNSIQYSIFSPLLIQYSFSSTHKPILLFKPPPTTDPLLKLSSNTYNPNKKQLPDPYMFLLPRGKPRTSSDSIQEPSPNWPSEPDVQCKNDSVVSIYPSLLHPTYVSSSRWSNIILQVLAKKFDGCWRFVPIWAGILSSKRFEF